MLFNSCQKKTTYLRPVEASLFWFFCVFVSGQCISFQLSTSHNQILHENIKTPSPNVTMNWYILLRKWSEGPVTYILLLPPSPLFAQNLPLTESISYHWLSHQYFSYKLPQNLQQYELYDCCYLSLLRLGLQQYIWGQVMLSAASFLLCTRVIITSKTHQCGSRHALSSCCCTVHIN